MRPCSKSLWFLITLHLSWHFWKTGGRLFLPSLLQSCILSCDGQLNGLAWQMLSDTEWLSWSFLTGHRGAFSGSDSSLSEVTNTLRNVTKHTNTSDILIILLVVVDEIKRSFCGRSLFLCRCSWWLLGKKWKKIIIPRLLGQSQY